MRYFLILLTLVTGCASLRPPVIKRAPDSFVRVQYTVTCEYETDCLRQIQDMDDGIEGGIVTFTSDGVAKVDGVQRIQGKVIQ